MGISAATLYDWKNKFPEISEALKNGKEVVDRVVENALYNKATGFTKKVTQPMKVKHVRYKDGKRESEDEEIIPVEVEQYYPPDVTAQIFWLKNRKSKEWRDKQEVEQTGAQSVTLDMSKFSTEELEGMLNDEVPTSGSD